MCIFPSIIIKILFAPRGANKSKEVKGEAKGEGEGGEWGELEINEKLNTKFRIDYSLCKLLQLVNIHHIPPRW